MTTKLKDARIEIAVLEGQNKRLRAEIVAMEEVLRKIAPVIGDRDMGDEFPMVGAEGIPKVFEWCGGYVRCPKCGGEVGYGADFPRPGDETQECVGFDGNREPHYDDAFAEENGCGWRMLTDSLEEGT